ncbi:MAG: cytochrome P450, partial [Acidobacteria bacterium]|nr:cytochrome P450 [Acidobacteriota bacterium]
TKKVFNDATSWVNDMSVRLFDSLPLHRSFDWYLSFAMPAAYYSACRIFGFSDSGAADFFKRGGGNLGSESFYRGFKEWCLSELRGLPSDGDDRMLNAFRKKVNEGLYTEDEAVEIILVMFHGALKTTASTLCILPMKLITREWGIDPMELEDERSLSKYIEEAIRLSPVLPRLVRTVSKATTIDGLVMQKGALVYLDVRAANRDGRRFDIPHKASLHSNHQRHLSFGAGMHQCIGMHMARHNINAILAPVARRLELVRHVGSKWATDTIDVYFHQPRYMFCRLDEMSHSTKYEKTNIN